MIMSKYMARIFPRLVGYRMARKGIIKFSPSPLILNFSVTNMCQSRCTTCNIWALYQKNPEKKKEELTTEEIGKLFATMDNIFLLNICGGEPFLRDDLPEICELAAIHIKPAIIHMPTNCLAVEKTKMSARRILEKIPRSTQLTIKLSMDGVGKDHDKIRGVEGNFKKLMQVHDYLVDLRKKYPNLYVDTGATISKANMKKLSDIRNFVNSNMNVDNYLNEVADTRAELFNTNLTSDVPEFAREVTMDLNVTPAAKDYDAATKEIVKYVKKDMRRKRKLSKITQALRIVYYERTARSMNEARRMVPCFAGRSNCHLNPWGDIWICNVQAFKHSMGNVKDFDFDFKKLWKSDEAERQRKWVDAEYCHCPLVGQGFLDTVLKPLELSKVFYNYFKYGFTNSATREEYKQEKVDWK
jgi:MoaA/NifB/PqqE/SkfB family radical SAM enzyme